MTTCIYCGATESSQFWHLNKYFGFNGAWCSKCYDIISHDAYGKPTNPKGLKKVQNTLMKSRK